MTPIDSVVDARGTRLFGRFPSRPTIVDPLAVRSLVPRALRALRLKQWVGWTLVHPDWAGGMILQDTGYLAGSGLYLANKRTGARHRWDANARGGSLRLPLDLFGSDVACHKGGFGVEYHFARGERIRIVIDVAAHDDEPAASGELVLDARPGVASADLAVSTLLPRGTMYTTKALYPVSGTLRVGDEDVVFDPQRDVAILDEHRSQLPYRTDWTWGTFAWHAGDGLAGANFAVRPQRADQEEESGLWAAGACEPLAGIVFEQAPGDDPLRPWDVESKDGRLDVVFLPAGFKDDVVNFGIAAERYRQWYGRYRGTVAAGGEVRDVLDVPGVLETMHARF
jgi:hypothetical protein